MTRRSTKGLTRSLPNGRKYLAEYRVWRGIVDRCTRPDAKGYEYYGGAGVRIHRTWTGPGGFDRFFAEVGPRPSHRHTIDRADGTRGYEPGNCKWATWVEQNNHRRSSRMVTLDGETMSAADWARRVGLKRRQTITNRLANGWHPCAAVYGLEGERKKAAYERLKLLAATLALLLLPSCADPPPTPEPVELPGCREKTYRVDAYYMVTCDPGQRAELLTSSVIACRCPATDGGVTL